MRDSNSDATTRVLVAVGAVTVAGLLGAIAVLAFSDAGRSALAPTVVVSGTSPTTVATATTTVPHTTVPTPTTASLTEEQQRAAEAARDQISYGPRSRAALIEYLTTERAEGTFAESDVIIAINSLNIDWDQQATEQAEKSLRSMAYSRQALIDRLEYKGFSPDQSIRAVDGLGVDWVAQAERSATDWARSSAVSRKSLLRFLGENYDKFELDEAEQGIDAAKIDWNAEAAEGAEDLLERFPDLTCDELRVKLSDVPRGEGFTDEQAEYGARVSSAC